MPLALRVTRPLALLLLAGAVSLRADEAVRAAVTKALPFVESRGKAWIEKRGCVSCHQVPSMLRSLGAAGARGFTVPRPYLETTLEWSTHWERWTNQGADAGRSTAESSNVDTMTALLLAGTGTADADWARGFRRTLLGLQQPDGSWKPGGQLPLQNRPVREQKEVTTLWAVLALRTDPAASEAVGRARKFLEGASPAVTVERLALELVLACEDGRPREAEVARLVAVQSKAGGWPWKLGAKPDAYGTGLALEALARAGLAVDHPAVAKGRTFLLSSQNADGSWSVPGTRTKDAGKVKPTATDWGTAWAVIGLVAFMPETKR